MAGPGPPPRSPPGWPRNSASPRSTRNAPGMRCRRSAGRSRRRVPRTRPRPAPKSRPPSKKTRRYARRRRGTPSRPPGRALLHGRAPHRAEAGHSAGSGRHAGRGPLRSAIIATSGSTSPPSSRRPPARATGTSATASPSRCSSAGWPYSPARQAQARSVRSSCYSTVPAGTPSRDCTCRTVCGSSTCRPTPPNSSPPSTSGNSSTSRSSLSTSAGWPRSRTASSNAAVTSKLNPTSCEPTPSFVGGHTRTDRTNQPETVSNHLTTDQSRFRSLSNVTYGPPRPHNGSGPFGPSRLLQRIRSSGEPLAGTELNASWTS